MKQEQIALTFQARHALLRALLPSYQQASSAQKTLLLDAFVEWTGYTRKHAIRLLNHGDQNQQTIRRHRLPPYRQEVQQALFLAWKATHYVCAKRLLPSLPSLMAQLEQCGHPYLSGLSRAKATQGSCQAVSYVVHIDNTKDRVRDYSRKEKDQVSKVSMMEDPRQKLARDIIAACRLAFSQVAREAFP